MRTKKKFFKTRVEIKENYFISIFLKQFTIRNEGKNIQYLQCYIYFNLIEKKSF